jgi:tRNA A-37 threonylcarbamoyl transferase component Bud32
LVTRNGRILGRYSIGEAIGSGGMGTVFEAYDELLDRRVAIKSLHEQYSADATVLERFRREAKIAAPLSHRGIAQVYDFAEEDGKSYIVMELLDGKDLQQMLNENGKLAPATAGVFIADAADALAHAHLAGVVHRDLKPGNIFVTDQGDVKVTDFGIAWAPTHLQLTTTKDLIGTPFYLSPEQVAGDRATASSDIYALGCVLYQLVTGNPPFEADTSVAVALAHRQEPVPSAKHAEPAVPDELDAIISKALQKDPVDRFATASGMASALRTFVSTEGSLEPTRTIVLPETQSAAATAVLPTSERQATTPVHQRSIVKPHRPWIAVGALLLLIAVMVLLADQLRSAARLVDVPSLTGLSFEQAAARAEAHGLKTSRSDVASDLPAGTVVGQQPAAGTPIGRGATISVQVSRGPSLAIPDVVGKTLDTATSTLESAGFKVAIVGTGTEGSVVESQLPASGSFAERGSTVTLTISSPTPEKRKGKGRD